MLAVDLLVWPMSRKGKRVVDKMDVNHGYVWNITCIRLNC
jgi:hypothetical protein